MRKLVAFVVLTLLCLLIGLAMIWVLVLEPAPNVSPASGAPTREQLQSAHELLRQQTSLIDARSGTITLSSSELDQLLALALTRLPVPTGARAELAHDQVLLHLSTQAPLLDRWFNVRALVVEDAATRLRLAELHVGRLRVPSVLVPLVAAEARRVLGQRSEWQQVERALASLQQLEISDNAIRAEFALTAALRQEVIEKQSDLLFGPAVRERAHRYVAELQALPGLRDREPLSLADALQPLAATMQESAGDPVVESRAMLLALTLHSVPTRLLQLIGGDDQLAAAVRIKPRFTLQRRHDLAQHFVLSALLASYGDEQLASRVGLYKELDDQQHRSGFDPTDLVADYAGIAFGELSVERPEWLQQRLLNIREADLLPPLSGLTPAAAAELLALAESKNLQQIEAGVERLILPLLLEASLYAEAIAGERAD